MDLVKHGVRFIITKDYEAMSKAAAQLFADQIAMKPDSVVGFATGGTPEGTYAALVELYKAGKVDFSKVTTFNLDEYYPIKRENDQSYYYFMHVQLFNHVNVDEAKVNVLNGEVSDYESECATYEQRIADAGGIDIQLLGIGLNGHLAFNEPADSFPRFAHRVSLTESTIEANARYFATPDDVPKHALTMGIGSVLQAKKLVLLANGAKKAQIIADALFGDIVPQVPASAIQLHRDVTVILDEAAAALIKERIGL